MHISARVVVGLASLASISSSLPTSNITASVPPTGVYLNASAVTNTTETTTNSTTIPASALPEIINATEKVDEDNLYPVNGFWMPGPVVIPAEQWEDIHKHSSYLSLEEEEDQSEDSYSIPPENPFLTPGPVVVPEDKLEEIHEHSSDLLQEEDDDHQPEDSDSHRLTPEERRRSSLVEANHINKRDGPGDPLPPRGRTLADHMENHGQDLPECYKRCMRSEDGKSSMHMGQDTLGTICGVKWPLFAWWSEHHIYWCVNGKGGCDAHERHREAYRWLKWTCGDKPK